MTSWFRSWHGAPTDNKWLVIAKRAGVAPGVVSAVFWALMDEASAQDDRGSIAAFDIETYALWAGWEEDDIMAIIEAMKDKGIITPDNRLSNWEKRQPKREDDSAARVRAFREKKKAESGSVTQCNASVTQCNAPDTDTDTETTILATQGADAPFASSTSLAEQFAELLAEMNKTKNKVPHLIRIYQLCFGGDTLPAGGELAGAAKAVGSAQLLAKYLFDNVTRPPVDVLPYIIATHKSKDSRAKVYGENRAVKQVTFKNGADDLYD